MNPCTKERIKRVTNLPISMIRGLLMMLLLLGLACKSQEKSKMSESQQTTQSSDLILLAADNYGGSENADFRVIRDMKTLRQFFGQVNKTRKPGLPVPEVDFSREIVILHCPGKMFNGDTSRLIIKENTPGQLVLTREGVEVKQKKENGALTMPFSLYKLPLTEKEIILQKE